MLKELSRDGVGGKGSYSQYDTYPGSTLKEKLFFSGSISFEGLSGWNTGSLL